MTTLTDAILAKLATAAAKADATDQKVGTERDTREGQVSSLQDRVHALEVDRDTMGTALIAANASIAEQTARVDALVSQLTELGVDSGI